MLSGAAAQAPQPEAEDVEARALTIDRRGGLSLYGAPFSPQPPNSGTFAPRTLTLWLPKTISLFGGGEVKACSEAKVRNAKFPDGLNSCSGLGSGRLGSRQGNREQTAWYAVAGPKQGEKRRVWLTTKLEDPSGDRSPSYGLETGVVEEASGAYGTKVVLRFGGLDIRTRAMEVIISNLRETKKCDGGWPLKMRVVAAEGTDSLTWRAKCKEERGSGRGGREP